MTAVSLYENLENRRSCSLDPEFLVKTKSRILTLTLDSRAFFKMPAHLEQLATHMYIQILIDYQIW